MLQSMLWTLAGLVTAGGGIVATALFVPSFALFLKAALDFLRSPIGIIVGGIAGAFLIYAAGWIGGDLHGTNTTRAAWRKAQVAAAEAKARSEAAIGREMKADVDAQLEALDRYNKTNDAGVQKHASDNPKTCPCRRATADDIRRLRAIR